MATKLLDVVAASLKPGLYLTDDQRLYRVLAVLDQNVELEDCRDPEGLPSWMTVRDVVASMRLVRPSGGAS